MCELEVWAEPTVPDTSPYPPCTCSTQLCFSSWVRSYCCWCLLWIEQQSGMSHGCSSSESLPRETSTGAPHVSLQLGFTLHLPSLPPVAVTAYREPTGWSGSCNKNNLAWLPGQTWRSWHKEGGGFLAGVGWEWWVLAYWRTTLCLYYLHGTGWHYLNTLLNTILRFSSLEKL